MTRKTLLGGFIALSSVAAFAADLPQEGHTYKLVNNQLVEVDPTPAPTPAQTPVQVIVNNNITQTVPQVTTAPAPAPAAPVLVDIPQAPSFNYNNNQYNFILSIIAAVNNHDYQGLNPFLVNGHVNYFGERHMTVPGIDSEMYRDSFRYGAWKATYDPSSFYREVSSEYSPHWQGPMIYDNISAYVDVYENGNRWHHALERWTVGYTYVAGQLKIYALVFKVLS